MTMSRPVTEPEALRAVPADSAAAHRETRGSVKLFYAVVVLTLVYCFAFVDRQIFNLLVAPIKADFGVSDIEIGYLLGPAFILSYVALGLPAGWCVDRFDRRNLMLIAGCCWGVGTIAAAMAHSYAGLFASRLMVGASEALVYPAGISFIADLFDRKRLPIATSIFLLAPSLGSGLSLIGGGMVLDSFERIPELHVPLLGDIHGWQGTLLVVGLIGFIPVLMLTTIRDGARQGKVAAPTPTSAAPAETQYGMLQGTGYMLQRWRFYLAFFFGMACSSMVMLTISAWAPTYLARTFHLTPAEIGARYGSLVLVFGLAGGCASPMINAWLARWKPFDSPMRTVLLGPCMLVVFAAMLGFVQSQTIALACLALLTFSYNFPLSMASTSLQLACPPRLRGVASAWYFVIVSLLGYGVGPTLVPYVTDKLLQDPNRIGVAMAGISVVFGILALLLCRVALAGFRAERTAE